MPNPADAGPELDRLYAEKVSKLTQCTRCKGWYETFTSDSDDDFHTDCAPLPKVSTDPRVADAEMAKWDGPIFLSRPLFSDKEWICGLPSERGTVKAKGQSIAHAFTLAAIKAQEQR